MKALVPDLAIVPRLLTRSALVTKKEEKEVLKKVSYVILLLPRFDTVSTPVSI